MASWLASMSLTALSASRTRTSIDLWVSVCVYAFVYGCLYVCMRLCVGVCMCVDVCMCLCLTHLTKGRLWCDCNTQIGVIDFGLYLKENNQSMTVHTPMELRSIMLAHANTNSHTHTHTHIHTHTHTHTHTRVLFFSRGSKQMAAILDQKNYLEELNRHLRFL